MRRMKFNKSRCIPINILAFNPVRLFSTISPSKEVNVSLKIRSFASELSISDGIIVNLFVSMMQSTLSKSLKRRGFS